MADFEDRLKRAARRFTETSTAEEQAREALEKQRSSFLMAFWDTGHNIIEPEMRRAEEALAPPVESQWSDKPAKKEDRIGVGVKWSDNDDRLIFTLTPGTKHAALVFLADPIKMRVRVLTAVTDLTTMAQRERRDQTAWDRMMEVHEGTASKIPALAEFTLDGVTPEIVRDHIANFVEQNM